MTNETVQQQELRPCPFCGGPADLRGLRAPEYWVGCSRIGCKATTEAFGSRDRAIKTWNRRTPSLDIRLARIGELEAVLGKVRACRSPAGIIEGIHGKHHSSGAWSVSKLTALLPEMDELLTPNAPQVSNG